MLPTSIKRPVVLSLFLGSTTFVEVAKLAAVLARLMKADEPNEMVPSAIQWLCRAQDYLNRMEWNPANQKISPSSLLDTQLELTGELDGANSNASYFMGAYSLLSSAQIHLNAANEKFHQELGQSHSIDSASMESARKVASMLALSKLEHARMLQAERKKQAEVERRVAKVLGVKEWPKDGNGERVRLTYEQVTRVWFPEDSNDKRDEMMVRYLPFFKCHELVNVVDDSFDYQPNNVIGRRERQLVRKHGMTASEVLVGARFMPMLRRAYQVAVNRANAAKAKGKPKKKREVKKVN